MGAADNEPPLKLVNFRYDEQQDKKEDAEFSERCNHIMSSSTPRRSELEGKECFISKMMNALMNDHLLEEILIRISVKSANQYKCVSKRWNSLISHPYFARHFMYHHHQSKKISDDDDLPPFTLLFQERVDMECKLEVFLTSDSQVFKSPGFSLSFLPCYPPYPDDFQLEVDGSFNDLLLCSATDDIYIICNPITMQFLELPPAPQLGEHEELFQVGFICDPIREQVDEQGCSVINTASYRYAVIRIPEFRGGSTSFKLEMFTSQTNEWSESYVLCPEGFQFIYMQTSHVTCNRIIYWLSVHHLFGYDAFATQEENRYQFIGLPSYFISHASSKCLGLCQGRVRLSQLLLSPHEYDGEPTLFIWELKVNNNWCLEHKVFLSGMTSGLPKLVQLVAGSRPRAIMLGFHPHDPDIVYLHLCYCIALCNVRSKTLKMVCNLPKKSYFGYAKKVFTLMLPPWPTPVPRLPSHPS